MQATIRFPELTAVQVSPTQWEAVAKAVIACQENHHWYVYDYREIVVNVNDPNPDKVHAVLDAFAGIGVVLG